VANSLQIHLISGNPHLRSLLTWHLQQAGYRLCQSNGMAQAKGKLAQATPHLVILDTELSDGNALELCSWIQKQASSLLLMLSTLCEENDIVSGLQAGADDYLSKPFGMQEFMARVEALTRRQRSSSPPASLHYGDLEVDLIQRRVKLKAEQIDLTPQEFSLLYVLVQALGQPLSRTDILERAWPNGIDNPRTVDTHILSLRKKLEVDPRQPSLIQTVRNVGYRFNLELLEPQETVEIEAVSQGRRSALMA
jgi:two-component system, OmpR family, response regulator